MRGWGRISRVVGVVGGAALLGGMKPGWAEVISPTPTLPLLGVPYIPSASLGCFPLAGVCVANGSVELTSVVSSTFNPSGQDIVADAVYSGQLTTLGGTALGPVSLSGTLEQEVLGRTFATERGSWTTDIVALGLSGPVLGHTLTLGLDPSHTSSGVSSIETVGNASSGPFAISSFFDVFVELSLDTTPPLITDRGPIHLAAVTVPEPASMLVLAASLLGFSAARRSRRPPACAESPA